MKKSLLLLFAAFVTLVTNAQTKVEIDGIWYNLITKGKVAEVTFKGDSYNSYYDEYSGSITIPATVTHNGVTYSVTSIGDYAFRDCNNLKSITIPEGVTSIGSGAFYDCNILTAVHISSIEAWCKISFDGNFSNPLYYAHNLYLNGELVTELVIPEGMTSIGNYAFQGCSSLSAINIPESVTSIGNSAFSVCSGLTDITIPEGVTSIGNSAFYGCSSLTAITLPEGVTNIESSVFYNCTLLTSITPPEGVTSIGERAFGNCYSLTTIVLPKNLKNIYSQAFANCLELHDVYCYAEKVPSTSTDAFDNSFPEYITLHVPASALKAYKTTAPWSSFGKFETTSIAVTGITLSVSSAILTEGESITLTATVNPEDATDKSISWNSSNPSVATVDGQGKVTAQAPGTAIITATATDGSGASASCKVEVVAAQQHSYTITFLVDGKVYHQESLEYGSSIVAPEAPTKEGYTFGGWSNIPETMPANNVTITGTFTANKYVVTVTVDGKVVSSYTTEYGSAIVVPEPPTKEGYTFGGWSEVPETMPAGDVTITGSFTINKYVVTFKVGDEVIVSDSLEYNTAIIIPEAPEREGHTFSGWGEVAETVPAHDVTYEGSFSVNSYLLTYMVDGEIYLQTTVEYGSAIVAPEAPTKEGHTFGGWSEMPETMPANDVTVTGTFTAEEQPETEIIASGTCGDSLTWVLTEEYELVIEGTGAMYDYSTNNVPWGDYRKSIQAVSLSEEMTSIGDYAFSNCTKLAAIAIPESVTSIGYRAFYRCSKLATVTITEESQLTSIGYAAFESCSKLTDITIPCGVTSIGEYAFFSCKKLASITCYAATPPTIGGVSTFYSVDKTIPVYVLDYTIAAYQSAKHWSEFTWFIGMETSITHSTLNSQTEFAGQSIYDLHGRRITDTEGLKGIYIVDGRKVVIK